MPTLLTNYETGGDEEQALGDSGDTDYIHSQGFQIQRDATITKIEIWIKDGPAAPTDNVTVRIETDAAGEPSGTLVDGNATGAIAQADIGAAFAWVDHTFASSFSLAKDTTYHLRISIPNQATNVRNHLQADASSPSYTYGTKCQSTDAGSNWTIQATHDLYFRVYKAAGGVAGYFNV